MNETLGEDVNGGIRNVIGGQVELLQGLVLQQTLEECMNKNK